MLRITQKNSETNVTLTLEGSLCGVWVDEFLDALRTARCSLAGRALHVDLTGVSHVDRAGEYLLALVRQNGGQLNGSGLMMTDLVQNIARIQEF